MEKKKKKRKKKKKKNQAGDMIMSLSRVPSFDEVLQQ